MLFFCDTVTCSRHSRLLPRVLLFFFQHFFNFAHARFDGRTQIEVIALGLRGKLELLQRGLVAPLEVEGIAQGRVIALGILVCKQPGSLRYSAASRG